MLKNIPYELVLTEENAHFIEYEGCFFKINENTYRLLSLLRQNINIQNIALELNVEITEIDNVLFQISELLTKPKKQEKIKPLFSILNDRWCNYLGDKLDFLFQKKIFQVLGILSVFLTSLYFTFFVGKSLLSLQIGFIGYFWALIIILFFHEFGHICAASNFKLKNLKISVGVFYLWPVFYINLNQQVLLSREKRMMVSAGGLYFQLLLNLLCIGLNGLFPHDFFLLVLHLNMILFLVNIAPVLILDGYWIYADWCRIENLDTKAKALLKIPLPEINALRNVPVTLLFYAVLRLLAMIFIYFMALNYLISNVKYFPDILSSLQENIGIGILFRILFLILPYLLFFTYLFKTVYGKFSKNH